jgi:hypothetical protein
MLPARNYYQRKTIELWKHQAITGLLLLIVIGFIFYIANRAYVQAYNNSFLSPLSEITTVYVTVYELPQTIEEEIRAVFGKDAEDAIKVAKCESGMRADAKNHNNNGSSDGGVFQINSVHGIRAKWLSNPSINIRVAKQLFDEQGWTPWRYSYWCHGVK